MRSICNSGNASHRSYPKVHLRREPGCARLGCQQHLHRFTKITARHPKGCVLEGGKTTRGAHAMKYEGQRGEPCTVCYVGGLSPSQDWWACRCVRRTSCGVT